MILGYEFKFHAAHHLEGHPTCGKIHGHTYRCCIEIEGLIRDDGFVVDFKHLKAYLAPLVEELDHTCLDGLVVKPTAECLVKYIIKRAKELLLVVGYVTVMSVVLWETDNCYVKTR
jgi:6-pyruvoyltetrahydropterin/6-carboxytetrahydropterin synthase